MVAFAWIIEAEFFSLIGLLMECGEFHYIVIYEVFERGRLSENSKDGKFSPTNNEKTGINCQYISHFNAENCNENGIESHQLLVFGQSGGGYTGEQEESLIWFAAYREKKI